MCDSKFSKVKNIIIDIETDLRNLKEQSHDLGSKIESNYLVPRMMSDQLLQTLTSYNHKLTLLEQSAGDISISLSIRLDQIYSELLAAESREFIASIRQLILDYFRLTTSNDGICNALEDSKLVLMDKCKLPNGETEKSLEPYIIVVKKIRMGNGYLSENEFDIVEDQIGKIIARAVDRNDLKIDSTYDISRFLDGFCQLLATESEGSTKMFPAAEAVENKETKEEINTEPTHLVTESGKESDEITSQSGTDGGSKSLVDDKHPIIVAATPLWNIFSGYVGDVQVTMRDVPAYSLGASKFISMAKQKPDTLLAIFILGQQKLMSMNGVFDQEENYIFPSEDIKDYLLKHEFFAEVTVNKEKENWSFLTLTSKGWACYSKSDILKYLNNQQVKLIVPKTARMQVSDMNPKNTLRLIAIHDYYSIRKPKKNYIVFTHKQENFIYANAIDNEGVLVSVCAAVFEEGNEEADLTSFREFVEEMIPTEELHIVVFAINDINELAKSLDLNEAVANQVKFCVFHNPEDLYDYSDAIAPAI